MSLEAINKEKIEQIRENIIKSQIARVGNQIRNLTVEMAVGLDENGNVVSYVIGQEGKVIGLLPHNEKVRYHIHNHCFFGNKLNGTRGVNDFYPGIPSNNFENKASGDLEFYTFSPEASKYMGEAIVTYAGTRFIKATQSQWTKIYSSFISDLRNTFKNGISILDIKDYYNVWNKNISSVGIQDLFIQGLLLNRENIIKMGKEIGIDCIFLEDIMSKEDKSQFIKDFEEGNNYDLFTETYKSIDKLQKEQEESLGNIEKISISESLNFLKDEEEKLLTESINENISFLQENSLITIKFTANDLIRELNKINDSLNYEFLNYKNHINQAGSSLDFNKELMFNSIIFNISEITNNISRNDLKTAYQKLIELKGIITSDNYIKKSYANDIVLSDLLQRNVQIEQINQIQNDLNTLYVKNLFDNLESKYFSLKNIKINLDENIKDIKDTKNLGKVLNIDSSALELNKKQILVDKIKKYLDDAYDEIKEQRIYYERIFPQQSRKKFFNKVVEAFDKKFYRILDKYLKEYNIGSYDMLDREIKNSQFNSSSQVKLIKENLIKDTLEEIKLQYFQENLYPIIKDIKTKRKNNHLSEKQQKDLQKEIDDLTKIKNNPSLFMKKLENNFDNLIKNYTSNSNMALSIKRQIINDTKKLLDNEIKEVLSYQKITPQVKGVELISQAKGKYYVGDNMSDIARSFSRLKSAATTDDYLYVNRTAGGSDGVVNSLVGNVADEVSNIMMDKYFNKGKQPTDTQIKQVVKKVVTNKTFLQTKAVFDNTGKDITQMLVDKNMDTFVEVSKAFFTQLLGLKMTLGADVVAGEAQAQLGVKVGSHTIRSIADGILYGKTQSGEQINAVFDNKFYPNLFDENGRFYSLSLINELLRKYQKPEDHNAEKMMGSNKTVDVLSKSPPARITNQFYKDLQRKRKNLLSFAMQVGLESLEMEAHGNTADMVEVHVVGFKGSNQRIVYNSDPTKRDKVINFHNDLGQIFKDSKRIRDAYGLQRDLHIPEEGTEEMEMLIKYINNPETRYKVLNKSALGKEQLRNLDDLFKNGYFKLNGVRYEPIMTSDDVYNTIEELYSYGEINSAEKNQLQKFGNKGMGLVSYTKNLAPQIAKKEDLSSIKIEDIGIQKGPQGIRLDSPEIIKLIKEKKLVDEEGILIKESDYTKLHMYGLIDFNVKDKKGHYIVQKVHHRDGQIYSEIYSASTLGKYQTGQMGSVPSFVQHYAQQGTATHLIMELILKNKIKNFDLESISKYILKIKDKEEQQQTLDAFGLHLEQIGSKEVVKQNTGSKLFGVIGKGIFSQTNTVKNLLKYLNSEGFLKETELYKPIGKPISEQIQVASIKKGEDTYWIGATKDLMVSRLNKKTNEIETYIIDFKSITGLPREEHAHEVDIQRYITEKSGTKIDKSIVLAANYKDIHAMEVKSRGFDQQGFIDDIVETIKAKENPDMFPNFKGTSSMLNLALSQKIQTINIDEAIKSKQEKLKFSKLSTEEIFVRTGDFYVAEDPYSLKQEIEELKKAKKYIKEEIKNEGLKPGDIIYYQGNAYLYSLQGNKIIFNQVYKGLSIGNVFFKEYTRIANYKLKFIKNLKEKEQALNDLVGSIQKSFDESSFVSKYAFIKKVKDDNRKGNKLIDSLKENYYFDLNNNLEKFINNGRLESIDKSQGFFVINGIPFSDWEIYFTQATDDRRQKIGILMTEALRKFPDFAWTLKSLQLTGEYDLMYTPVSSEVIALSQQKIGLSKGQTKEIKLNNEKTRKSLKSALEALDLALILEKQRRPNGKIYDWIKDKRDKIENIYNQSLNTTSANYINYISEVKGLTDLIEFKKTRRDVVDLIKGAVINIQNILTIPLESYKITEMVKTNLATSGDEIDIKLYNNIISDINDKLEDKKSKRLAETKNDIETSNEELTDYVDSLIKPLLNVFKNGWYKVETSTGLSKEKFNLEDPNEQDRLINNLMGAIQQIMDVFVTGGSGFSSIDEYQRNAEMVFSGYQEHYGNEDERQDAYEKLIEKQQNMSSIINNSLTIGEFILKRLDDAIIDFRKDLPFEKFPQYFWSIIYKIKNKIKSAFYNQQNTLKRLQSQLSKYLFGSVLLRAGDNKKFRQFRLGETMKEKYKDDAQAMLDISIISNAFEDANDLPRGWLEKFVESQVLEGNDNSGQYQLKIGMIRRFIAYISTNIRYSEIPEIKRILEVFDDLRQTSSEEYLYSEIFQYIIYNFIPYVLKKNQVDTLKEAVDSLGGTIGEEGKVSSVIQTDKWGEDIKSLLTDIKKDTSNINKKVKGTSKEKVNVIASNKDIEISGTNVGGFGIQSSTTDNILEMEKFLHVTKQAKYLSENIDYLESAGKEDEIANLQAQLENDRQNLTKQYQELFASYSNLLSAQTNQKNIQDKVAAEKKQSDLLYNQRLNELKELYAGKTGVEKALIGAKNRLLIGDGDESDVASIQKELNDFETKIKEVTQALANMKTDVSPEAIESGRMKISGYEKRYQERTAKEEQRIEKENLREYKSLMRSAISTQSNIWNIQSQQGRKYGLEKRLGEEEMAVNQEYLDQIQERMQQVRAAIPQEELEKFNAEMENALSLRKAQAKTRGRGIENFWQGMKKSISDATIRLLEFSPGLKLANSLQKSINKVVETVYKLDKSMTNLRIVTGNTYMETKSLITSYSDLGKELAATTEEVANAANDWLRQGYSVKETNDLITSSLYLSKLGMIDSASATKYLTSVLKGYKMEVSEATDIVDKFVAVDMNAAASASDIAEAMSRTSVSAQLAGVNMNNLIGYLTEIIQVSQKDAGSVGESFKTMLSRYGNVKAGAFSSMSLSEDSETTSGINDIEKVLGKIGISVRKNNLEFRDFDDVLSDVAKKWQTLDNVSKNAISTALGGARQRENVNILLENYEEAIELSKVAAESEGTAIDKYSSYTDSLEASQKRIQNAWEKFSNSTAIQESLTLFNNVISEAVEKLPDLLQLITTLFATMNAYKIPTWISNMSNFFSLSGMGTRFKELGSSIKEKNFFKTVYSPLEKQRSEYEASQDEEYYKTSLLSSAKNKLIGKPSVQKDKALSDNTTALNNLTAALTKNSGSTDNNTMTEKKLEKEVDENTGALNKNTDSNNVDNNNISAGRRGSGVSTRLLTTAAAGVTSGLTQGMFQTRSDGEAASTGAKIASGITGGGLTALGTAIGGPIGGLVGQFVGKAVGQVLTDWIDRQEIYFKKEQERIDKVLASVNGIKDSTDNISGILEESSQKGLLSSDVITEDEKSQIKEQVSTLRTSLGEQDEGRSFETEIEKYFKGTEYEGLSVWNLLAMLERTESREEAQTILAGFSSAAMSAENKAAYEQYKLKQQESQEYIRGQKVAGQETIVYQDGLRTTYEKTHFSGYKVPIAKGIFESSDDIQDWAIKKGYVKNITEYHKGERYFNTPSIEDQLDYLSGLYDHIDEYEKETGKKISEKTKEKLKKGISERREKIQATEESKTGYQDTAIANILEQSGISDLSENEIKMQGKTNLFGQISGYMKADTTGAFSEFFDNNGNLTKAGENFIYSALKKSNPQAQTALEAKDLTLKQLFGAKQGQDIYNVDQGIIQERITDFAQALGISEEELRKMSDYFDEVSSGDLLSSSTELAEKMNSYNDILTDLFNNGKVTLDTYSKIISSYPELIDLVSNPDNLTAKLIDKIDDLSNIYALSLFDAVADTESMFEKFANYINLSELIKTPGLKDVGKSKNLTEFLGYLAGPNVDESVRQDILNQIKDFYGDTFKFLGEKVSELKKQLRDSQVSKVIEYQTKLLESQVSALEEQKSAITDITKKREEETKLIEKQLELQNAFENKRRVYRAGIGFVYEADQSEIATKEKELQELQNAREADKIQVQIDELKTFKDALENIADRDTMETLAEANNTISAAISPGGSFYGLIDSLINYKSGSTVVEVSDDEILGYLRTIIAKKQSSSTGYAAGTSYVPKSDFYHVNERGTEGVITPNGSIAFLEQGSKILNAQATQNLYNLANSGTFVKLPGSIYKNYQSSHSSNIDSLSIGNMTIEMNADGSFSAEKFIQDIKTQARLTKNERHINN